MEKKWFIPHNESGSIESLSMAGRAMTWIWSYSAQ